MTALKRIAIDAARLTGYASLATVLAAAAIVFFIGHTDACPVFHEQQVLCSSPSAQILAQVAMRVTQFTSLTGLPLLLAMLGAVVAVIDVRRWRARQRRAPNIP